MRLALAVLALSLEAGAFAEPPQSRDADVVVPEAKPHVPQHEGRPPCRDTIHQVREERGLPQLRRETASPDEPLLIAAVDHRVNGCAVMVMLGDTSDVRPLPILPDRSEQLQRVPAE